MTRTALVTLAAGLIACAIGTDAPLIERHVLISEETLKELPTHELLHRVRDLQVDNSGRVWILSVDSPFISAVQPDDGDLTSFGTPGPGPEEMATPWSVIPNGTGGAVIWDAGRRRVLEFNQVGDDVQFVSGVHVEIESSTVLRSIEASSYGTPLRMRKAGSIFVVQPAHRPVLNTGDLREIVLLTGPAPSQIQDTLYVGPRRAGSSSAEFLVPIPLWAACANGDVVVFEPPDQLISIRTAPGTADTIVLPLHRRKMDDGDIRRFLRYSMELELVGRVRPSDEVIERRIDQVLRRGRDIFSSEAPLATNLLCDDFGYVWIQGFDTEEHPAGFGRDWWVVGTNRVVAAVRFPRGFQPRVVSRFGIYGTLRDSLGLERPHYVPADAAYDLIYMSTDTPPASVDTLYPQSSTPGGGGP